MVAVLSRQSAKRLALFALMFLGFCVFPVFAGGAKEIDTEIQLSRPPAYISPGNPATGHDSLTIDNIKLTIDPKGAIKSYTLNIYNKNGEIIFSRSESKLEGRGFFGDLLNIGEVPQVKIPANFNWPGTDQSGKIVPDGEYAYQLTILDSFSKKTSTAPLSVVVDTKAPQIIAIANNYRIFSPNGDKIRDTITFTHKTEAAYKWTESILDDKGNLVWEKVTQSPGDTAASDTIFASDTVWDGVASLTAGAATSGQTVPEGNYVYRFAGSDRAGNSSTKELPFVVSFSQSDIILSIGEQSPNFNTQRGIDFMVAIGDGKGLVAWKLEIADSEGIVNRRFSGTGLPPEKVHFEAKGNPGRPDSEGNVLKDGNYRAQLFTSYDSGAQSASDPIDIAIDNASPYAQLTLNSSPTATEHDAALIFGGAGKEKLQLTLKYEPKAQWAIHIAQLAKVGPHTGTDSNAIAAQFDYALPMFLPVLEPSESRPAENELVINSWLWDGSLPPSADENAPKKLPDGTWKIWVSGIDQAGNEGLSTPVRFISNLMGTNTATTIVDTPDQPTNPVANFQGQIVADPAILNADGNGGFAPVNLSLKVSAPEKVASWRVDILDPNQKAFKSWAGANPVPASIEWDGKSEQGEAVQSASDYVAVFTIQDGQGQTHRSMVTLTSDILVIKEGDRYRIVLPNIEFPGNSADLFENAKSVLDRNLETLRRLAKTLQRFKDYKISIEGNAVHVQNGSPAEIAREEREELLPLSSKRALIVKQALTILAVEWERMTTVGLGGTKPIVPHTDLENRWKNRRVEFILER